MSSLNLNPLVLLKDLQDLGISDNQIVEILNRWLWWLSLSDDWKEIFINKVLKLYNISEQDFLNLAVFRSFSDQLFSLTKIDLSNCNISTLCKLSLFKELQHLNLSHNQIIDFSPLSKLQLKFLDISHNNISDIIPLAVLKDLQGLNLSHNQIIDISPLSKLQQLNDLDISNNQISNITSLAKLEQLKELDFSNNEIVEIRNSWLWWLSLSHEWKKIFINKVLKLKNISEPYLINQDVFISFSDKLFSLTEINLSNCNISTLCDLSLFKKLSTLYIADNNISDITPLAKLKWLTELFIRNNQISDIAPLAELTNLTKLDIGYNQISDIAPLAELKQLTILFTDQNQISDITPFAELTNLITLGIGNNPISDIRPVCQLKKLKALLIRNTQVSADDLKKLKASCYIHI